MKKSSPSDQLWKWTNRQNWTGCTFSAVVVVVVVVVVHVDDWSGVGTSFNWIRSDRPARAMSTTWPSADSWAAVVRWSAVKLATSWPELTQIIFYSLNQANKMLQTNKPLARFQSLRERSLSCESQLRRFQPSASRFRVSTAAACPIRLQRQLPRIDIDIVIIDCISISIAIKKRRNLFLDPRRGSVRLGGWWRRTYSDRRCLQPPCWRQLSTSWKVFHFVDRRRRWNLDRSFPVPRCNHSNSRNAKSEWVITKNQQGNLAMNDSMNFLLCRRKRHKCRRPWWHSIGW